MLLMHDTVHCSSQSTTGDMYEHVDMGADRKPDRHETTLSVQEKSKTWKKSRVVIATVLTLTLLDLVLALVAVIITITTKQEIQALQFQLNTSNHGMKTFVEQLNIELKQEIKKLRDNAAEEVEVIRITLQKQVNLTHILLPGTKLNPIGSCRSIPQDRPSGEYWIQSNSSYSPVQVYCDMDLRSCSCNAMVPWMRVANFNMTKPSQQCPIGFRRIDSPKRTCGRPGTGCYSTTYPLNGISYSHVCGRIKAYQYHSPDAFLLYYHNRALTIDSNYVHGVSLTHGQNPRKHIWTFANALDEVHSNEYVCPCIKTDSPFTGIVPPFIGNDYFCDTGSRSHFQPQFYSEDPLWDGAGCGGTSTCCQFNNPPWFCKQLPQPTTDDIELRLCADGSYTNDEDIAIEQVELYVQ